MADPAEDLDALVRRVDPDRWLSSRFIDDAQARADVIAIYAYDHELARAPKVASNPLLGEIRLTWWREALDEIFEDRAVRLHPTAQALAAAVRRHGLPREPLEAMIDARYRELDAAPMSAEEAKRWALDVSGSACHLAIAILEPAWLEYGAGAICWAALWGLGRLTLQGAVAVEARAEARAELSLCLAEARTVEKGSVPPRCFPAVAHATLARAYIERREPSLLGKQWRIIVATARGWI
jgi:phytoene synthase